MIEITVTVDFTGNGGTSLEVKARAMKSPYVDEKQQTDMGEVLYRAIKEMANCVLEMKLTNELKAIIASIQMTSEISGVVDEAKKMIEEAGEDADPDEMVDRLTKMVKDKLGLDYDVQAHVENIPKPPDNDDDVPQEFKDFFSDKKGGKS